MGIRLVRLIIAGCIYSGFIFTLSGCAEHGVWHRTKIRDLPDELETKLSVGDARQKVRYMLGDPLLDARRLGVELYRKSGRDIDYDLIIAGYPPIPFVLPEAGQKVIVFVMVAYDGHDVAQEITTNFWIPGYSHDFWVTVGGYTFVNSYYNEPDTILAQPVTWEELAVKPDGMEGCTLVLLMGECPMEEVSLDNSHIIDLSPAGGWCGIDTWQQRENNLYGAFIRKDITPGSHRLEVSQKTKHGDFGANFTCEPGETVFAELKASHVVPSTWPHERLQGAISISKSADIEILRPIIWHQGKWYGSVTSPAVGN
jgi:hypothetical protein